MNHHHKVLVVDDEPHIRKLTVTALERAEYVTIEARDARETMALIRSERPAITLLDLGLPDRDGLELVPLIKQQSDTTLIIISAREATEEKVAALDLGADDYLTKPFDTDELLARVRVALRNRLTRDGGTTALAIGDIVIDLLSKTITRAGEGIHLTRKEFGVLEQLAKYPGRVITHKHILTQVWPNEVEPHVEYLRVIIRSLRQKLEPDPQFPKIITNELGIGYRLRMMQPESGGADFVQK